jgi:ribosome modulation factor
VSEGTKDPWLLGKEAFWNDKSEDDCPFPSGSEEASNWMEGYRDAKHVAELESKDETPD